MDVDTPTRPAHRDAKIDDDGIDSKVADGGKHSYRSWKKKYRKMRIDFDQKMHESEELYKLEVNALETARRLAIEKE
jgi:hypothetical protein